MRQIGAVFVYCALLIAIVVPISAAAMSPLLAWRDPVYITAGFAGVVALTLMLLQPVLAAGYLPGITLKRGRNLHRWVGSALVVSVVIHVVGLWITSPPDVIDALLFSSPTPFSNWGVISMWGVFASACLVVFRRRFRFRLRAWRLSHRSLAAIIVIGSVVHAMKVEGTMEIMSKSVLCVLLVVSAGYVLINLEQRN